MANKPEPARKPYHTPILKVYGNIQAITQGSGTGTHSDLGAPHGAKSI
jgi:hypothetical protein